MAASSHHALRRCHAVLLLASLLLAACATTGGKPAYFPPDDPQSYFTVTVRSGDTLSEIADRYQVDSDVLLSMNDIGDPNAIMAGTMIKVPSYGHERDANDMSVAPVEPRPKPEFHDEFARYDDNNRDGRVREIPLPQPKPVLTPISASASAPASSWWDGWFGSSTTVTATDSTTTNAPPEPAPPSKTAASNKGFIWPVSGQVLSGFGTGKGGERNDGINIAAARGAPVRAAASGTVTYVGNELKGYGNLVLIRHDNGYVTAYAHSDSVTVERGEHVNQGEIIAYAGETGDVSQPQVHFELRQGTKPVNPESFLVASD